MILMRQALSVLLAGVCLAAATPAVGAPPTPPTPPSPPSPPAGCPDAAEATEPPVLEVTFGSSQLFAHQSFTVGGGQVRKEVIPVTSALLMAEWLVSDRTSVVSLFNLPLDTQKVIEDGKLEETFVAPSIALGLRVSPVRLDVFRASRLEVQLAALAGVTVGSQFGDTFFPLVATRLHFATHDGFALYLGAAHAFQKDTLAMLYGIGYRF